VLDRRFEEVRSQLKFIMFLPENEHFIGEQKFLPDITAYMKALEFKVSFPDTGHEPSFLMLLKEPAVPKRSTELLNLFRHTGLSYITQKISRDGMIEFVNPSIKFLLETMPQSEGLGEGAVEEKAILLDRFPFHRPYGYNLDGFLKMISEGHVALFKELNSCVNDLFELVLKHCAEQSWNVPTLYTFGQMAQQTTQHGHLLYLPITSVFTAVVSNMHPGVFVDSRHVPTTPDQYLRIQNGYDHLHSAVTENQDFKGKFCANFQIDNAALIAKVARARIDYGFGGVFESEARLLACIDHRFGGVFESEAQLRARIDNRIGGVYQS
jgi:hypothetical protein